MLKKIKSGLRALFLQFTKKPIMRFFVNLALFYPETNE